MAKHKGLYTTIFVVLGIMYSNLILAGNSDPVIEYHVGRGLQEEGQVGEAYARFRNACMAPDGVVNACLEWANLAKTRENSKDLKRALSSAVMLDPDHVGARYELALLMLEKEDWTWAIEHLAAALDAGTEAGTSDVNLALLRYYLGYAQFKSGQHEEAHHQLALARTHLPSYLQQRATFYMGLALHRTGHTGKAVRMMNRASAGEDETISKSAKNAVKNWSSFPRPQGVSGNVVIGVGVDTRPYADIVDSQGIASEDSPAYSDNITAIRNTYRGDLIFGNRAYKHGIQEVITFYRELTLYEFRDDEAESDNAYDYDFTMLASQTSFVARGWVNGKEHEFRAGLDGDLQFLDKVPIFNKEIDEIEPGDQAALYGKNVGGKIWWSLASNPSSVWNVRFKLEGRDNNSNEDRSVVRTRLRFANTRHFLDRDLRLKLLVGGIYDRSYKDPHIIKYDKLAPEAWVDLKWQTPASWLSALLVGKFKYNWYMNSKNTENNKDNSFRPPFQTEYLVEQGYTAAEIAEMEAEYDKLTRKDFEWELTAELIFSLWKKGSLVLQYKHNSRYSNIDSAPKPKVQAEDGSYYRYPAYEYGYHRNRFFLEIRQRF